MVIKRKTRKCWSVALVVLLLFAMIISMNPVPVYAADEFDDLREKYKIRLTGYDPNNPYDSSDQYVKLSLDKINSDVNHWWPLMNAYCTWDDVMDSSATNANDMYSIITRLQFMTMGWATYGSDYYGNAALLDDIKTGLDWFYNNRYNETMDNFHDPNGWFMKEIGAPTCLDIITILLYDQLSSTQITNYMNAVNNWSPGVVYEGANRVWKCQVVGLRAVIVKDSTKLQDASDGLDEVLKYVTSSNTDGFYTDGSFLQHNYYPYAGGYGRNLILSLSELLWLLGGSTWENDSPDKGNVYNWIFDTFEPAMLEGTIFDSLRGREIGRRQGALTGIRVINGMLFLIEIPSNPYIDTFKSIVKYNLQNDYQDAYFRNCDIWYYLRAKAILNDAQVSPASAVTGNYQFYNEDRVIHRTTGGAFDIAMHSNRIQNFETGNVDGLKGWYTADGMTYLHLSPSDYAFNFWPTVDPHRLPGITVDSNTSVPNCQGQYTFLPNTWVGGVSLDGKYGTAGMDFKQHNHKNPIMDVAAKKSWFMFDDEVVSLGAGITSTTGSSIETVVENRLLNSLGDNSLTVNGNVISPELGWSAAMSEVNWVHLDGTGGYVFPGGAAMNGLRERREGNWIDIDTLYYDKANDEFNTTIQGAAWMWKREDSVRHSLTGDALAIATTQGSLEGSTNSTKNIIVAPAPNADFYSDTKLTFSPTTDGQEAGLILYTDDDNYIYISRAYTTSGQCIVAAKESGGIYTENAFTDTYGSTVYFKIEKRGSDYLLYASSDGQTWGTALCNYSSGIAGPDDFNSCLSMGLFAQNGNNPAAPEITASFDYFHVKLVANYMTLWFNHGVNPTDASYSYITLPNKTTQEVSDYSSNPDVSILKNDKTVQAVKENTLGIIGANFWSAGNVSYITSYDPAAVMVKDQNSQLEISVSDPTHLQSTVRVELSRWGRSVLTTDPGVTVVQMYPTIILDVNTSEAAITDRGKTHTVTISYDPLAPTLSPRTVVQLQPVADSYVRDGGGWASNNGTKVYADVHCSGTPGDGTNEEAFYKFDLHPLTENITIESAKLYLHGVINESGGTDTDIKLNSVDNDNWTETGIIWTTKPATSSAFSTTVHVTDQAAWSEIDLTSYVQSQYANDKVVSLSLWQNSPCCLTRFDTRTATEYRPYLEITGAYPGELLSAETDAYVRSDTYADTNYGTESALVVKNTGDPDNKRQSYLKFDLSSISDEVASAKLYLYGIASGGSTASIVYGVDDDTWSETGITWNNKPAAAGSALSSANVTEQWAWREFDMTSYVQAQQSGDKIASLVVVQDVPLGCYTEFKSREYTYSQKPFLKVMTAKNISPTADAYVRSGTYADSNYGTEIALVVKNTGDADNKRQSYLKFDLSSISGEVASAKLYLYGIASGGSTVSSVYGVDDDTWSETGIIWNNKPAAAGSALSSVNVTEQWAWREFDVTSYVQAQQSGDKTASLVVVQDVPLGFYTEYKSREYTYSQKPYLKVTYLQP